jgi:hypothetical protein
VLAAAPSEGLITHFVIVPETVEQVIKKELKKKDLNKNKI